MARLDALYAWVVTYPDGNEAICNGQVGPVQYPPVPLVGADIARVKALREHAEVIGRATGWPVQLVAFARRDDIEESP